MVRSFSLLLMFVLASCGSPNDPGEGGVTRREAQELDEAAKALDHQQPAPSLANTQIPAVPAPPPDPEIDGR